MNKYLLNIRILASVSVFVTVAIIYAQEQLVLPVLDPVPTEHKPNHSKPGGITLGPAMPRAFHYGGRQAVRDFNGLLHVTWEDSSFFSHYYSRSLDSLGLRWTDPINPMDSVGFIVDRALMAKMAIDPVSGYLYMMPFYRVNPGETYKTGITRSTDNGETWSTYLNLGTKLGRPDEELAWGTLTIGDDQILHICVTKDTSTILYTCADLTDIVDLEDLIFTGANGITAGGDSISVASNVIFQGTIILDRNNDPHIIFSGDGDPDTFGDKTPYHVYYKSAAGTWGPNPPLQLMTELEQTWGMPELVFDANNRGYYFLDNKPGDFLFGTWEPPINDTSATDFGTLNNTGNEAGVEGAVYLTNDNFPFLNIDNSDDLYLPNADVDDENNVVYVVASTNGRSGGDIVLLMLGNATSYSGQDPDSMFWRVRHWMTQDGDALPDIAPDIIYDPSSTNIDIFWSGIGAEGYEAQYLPGHITLPDPVSIRALYLAYSVLGEKIFINKGDEILLSGVIGNSGYLPADTVETTLTIFDSSQTEIYAEIDTTYDLEPYSNKEISFESWTVTGDRQRFFVILTSHCWQDPTYDYPIGRSFFAYPNPDNAFGWESFQDSSFTNYPTFLADGSQFINNGTWYPANASTGGWSVIDSTHNEIAEYISTWTLLENWNDDVNSSIRHQQGVKNDTLYRDISAPPRPQNELLFSPWYYLSNMEIVTLEWDDRIAGTDGANNYPVHAFVDITIDGGQTWLPVYHRSDTAGTECAINGYGYQIFDITNLVMGADSVQIRFWWRNPNNDGSYATWEIDNVYLMNRKIVGTIVNPSQLPHDFVLHQNYPNPFNPVTTISYSVPVSSPIILRVYDILGREATTRIDGVVAAGVHRVRFDAGQLASGIYLYRLETPDRQVIKKMLVLR